MLETAQTEIGDFFAWLFSDGTQWAIWASVAIAVFIGLRFLRAVIAGLFKSSKRPPNSFRNIVGSVVAGTTSLFLLILAFFVTAPFTINEMPEKWDGMLATAFMVISVLQFAFWLRVIARALLDRMVDKHDDDVSSIENARALITVLVNVAIFAFAAITILDNLGQDVGALIAGLGVGGIAIALAAQSVVKDLFASVSILLDKPFIRGDFIIWKGDFMGTVQRIGLKTTQVRSLTGEQIVVSNDQLLSNEIRNYKRMYERRVVLGFGVTYQSPREALEALPGRVQEIVEAQEKARFDRCHMAKYADSSINFELVFFVLSPDYNVYMDVQQDILFGIHRVLEDMNLDFAYPTRTLFIEGTEAPAENAAT